MRFHNLILLIHIGRITKQGSFYNITVWLRDIIERKEVSGEPMSMILIHNVGKIKLMSHINKINGGDKTVVRICLVIFILGLTLSFIPYPFFYPIF